jgi:signal peptidase I
MTQTESFPSDRRSFGSRLRILAIGRDPRVTLVRAVVLAIVCVVVAKFVLLPVRVDGISMWPTYRDHSVNFINRLPYLWHDPQRGDVVGIRLTPPGGFSSPHVMYLKRIIGLPGETVSFVNGKVFIDGQILVEPYETNPCNWNCDPVTLEPGEYFVVGDNRTMDKQFHEFGRTLRNRIVGKTLL